MTQDQKKIFKYFLLFIFFSAFALLGYVITSPSVGLNVDIGVSNPTPEVELDPESIQVKLDEYDLNWILPELKNSGLLEQIENTSYFTLLVPIESSPTFVLDKHILTEEIYVNAAEFPFETQNQNGDLLTFDYDNGAVFIKSDEKDINVIVPDIQFNKGSIIIIEESL